MEKFKQDFALRDWIPGVSYFLWIRH